MNKKAKLIFEKMKADPHSVSLKEILLIADGFIEELNEVKELLI